MIILGILIGLFIGTCIGVVIMAVLSIGRESEEEADRIDAEMTAAEIASLYDEQEGVDEE